MNNDQFYVHVAGRCPCGLIHTVRGAEELNAQAGLADAESEQAFPGIYDKIIERQPNDPLVKKPRGRGK